MDAQFRRQSDVPRAAADAPPLQPKPPAPGPVRGVQEATAWAAARLRRSPWWVWVLAAGAFVGSERLRAKTRPAGPAPTPPPRAAVPPPRGRPRRRHARPPGHSGG
jgi:hypothetical protein